MRYLVTYRPETAMRPETLEAEEVRVLHREGVALFEPTAVNRESRPTVTRPLRFLTSIEAADAATGTVYLSPDSIAAASADQPGNRPR